MPNVTIPPNDTIRIKETYNAIALEDIGAGDYVSNQFIVTDPIEVSLWRNNLGLLPDGMALASAKKGEFVECAKRMHITIRADLMPDEPYFLKGG